MTNEQLRLLILVEPKCMSTREDRFTMAHIAQQLHSICSRESELHLNLLTSPHPVRFKEKILLQLSECPKLSVELIIVLFRLDESVWLPDGPCGSGHSWLIIWPWLWQYCFS